MDEKETRSIKKGDKANARLGIVALGAIVLLIVTSIMLILQSRASEEINLWYLLLGVLGLCAVADVVIAVTVAVFIDKKHERNTGSGELKEEKEKRGEAEEDEEKRNALLQTEGTLLNWCKENPRDYEETNNGI